MFKWIKDRRRRKQAKRLMVAIPAIISRYGELMEQHPTAIIDTSQLPANKLLMKEIIKAEWRAETNEKRRDALAYGYVFLAQFQDGVGENPIDCHLPEGAAPEAVVRIMDAYLPFSNVAARDAADLTKEFKQFTLLNSD